MRTFDQIIFDELSAGRSVMLEEIGYLNIDARPAQVTRNNTIAAPRKVVVYTPDAISDARNAINILEAEGVDYQQARDQYYTWLAEARKDSKLTILNTGVLKDSIFTPSTELQKILNPNAAVEIAAKRGGNGWIWIVIVIILLLLLAFFLCRSCNGISKRMNEPNKVETAVQQQTPAEVVPDSAAVAQAKAREAELAEANATANATQNTGGMNYPAKGRYYIVAGVFDIPANADNLIKLLKPYFPDFTYEKFDYPGIRPGRTMVTVFSSTNYAETLNMRRQLAWNHDLYDYWIYPVVK